VSHTIWLQFRRGGEVTGGDRDNSIMLRLAKELDSLADQLAVARLSSFYQVWSDSAAGHESIAAILSAIQADPGRLNIPVDPSREHWRDLLLQELAYCAAGLKSAAEDGSRFRFRVVA
jgi:hypothetical protein